MRITRADFGYHVVLDPDDVIEECFFRFAKDERPPSLHIVGMGSVKELKIGFYDSLTDQFVEKRLDDCLEMTSFIGNLAYQHDIPILHAHVTAATRDFQLVGGHFISGRVNMTGEFALLLDQVAIQRRVPLGRSIPLIEGMDRR